MDHTVFVQIKRKKPKSIGCYFITTAIREISPREIMEKNYVCSDCAALIDSLC